MESAEAAAETLSEYGDCLSQSATRHDGPLYHVLRGRRSQREPARVSRQKTDALLYVRHDTANGRIKVSGPSMRCTTLMSVGVAFRYRFRRFCS